MKLSDRLKKEREFIKGKLGDQIICERCGATLNTFAEVCPAALDDPCPGFLSIDSAKAQFNSYYATLASTDGGTTGNIEGGA